MNKNSFGSARLCTMQGHNLHMQEAEKTSEKLQPTTTNVLPLPADEDSHPYREFKFECQMPTLCTMFIRFTWIRLETSSISEGVGLASVNPLEAIMQPRDECVSLTATLLSWKQGGESITQNCPEIWHSSLLGRRTGEVLMDILETRHTLNGHFMRYTCPTVC